MADFLGQEDILPLFGDDPAAAQMQARALADAMQRRRAAGTIATVIGGPFAKAGQAFLGEAEQTQGDLTRAGQFRSQQALLRSKAAQDQAQFDANQKAAAARHAEDVSLRRQAMEQDAWAAVPDQLGGVVMFNRKTGESRPMGPQNPGQPGASKAPVFKNEAQGKAFSYAGRLREARRQMEEAGYPEGLSGRADAAAMGAQSGPISSLVPQEAASEPGSRYYNAARNLVAALLRKESGAAISNDEWKQFTGLYVPMPWDSPEARANKLKFLDLAEQSLAAEAGPSGAAALQAQSSHAAPQASTPAAPAASSTPPAKVRKFNPQTGKLE